MKRSITALIAGSLLAISFRRLCRPRCAIEGVEKQPVNAAPSPCS
jgi:hypothetical protein